MYEAERLKYEGRPLDPSSLPFWLPLSNDFNIAAGAVGTSGIFAAAGRSANIFAGPVGTGLSIPGILVRATVGMGAGSLVYFSRGLWPSLPLYARE